MTRPVWHMLKKVEGRELHTRCGETIKVANGATMRDHFVTGWDSDVTCDGCKLDRQGDAGS
jgi:hypothetical protein